VEFLFEAGATVEALQPSWGVSGTAGQVVTVVGRHFVRSGELSCRFGLQDSLRGEYGSSTMVTCVVPERVAGTVAVTVSNNGIESGSDGVLFQVKDLKSAWKVYPSNGPLTGGTLVTLMGAGGQGADAHMMRCRFGEDLVVPLSASSEGVVCVAPSGETVGGVRLTLVDAASQNTLGESVLYRYDGLKVTGVRPSRGVLTGGTAVHVTGSGFREDAGLRCRFGESGTVKAGAGARWVSSTVVMCVAPRPVEGQAMQVALEECERRS